MDAGSPTTGGQAGDPVGALSLHPGGERYSTCREGADNSAARSRHAPGAAGNCPSAFGLLTDLTRNSKGTLSILRSTATNGRQPRSPAVAQNPDWRRVGRDLHTLVAAPNGGYVRAPTMDRLSHQLITPATTRQFGMADAGQTRLAVVRVRLPSASRTP